MNFFFHTNEFLSNGYFESRKNKYMGTQTLLITEKSESIIFYDL